MAVDLDPTSAQALTFIYILPIVVSLVVLASPIAVFASLTDGTFGRGMAILIQITWSRPQRLSQFSVGIILLSPFLLLSHYIRSTLYLFAVYSVLLALANLLVDWLGKKKAWLILCLWQTLNLMNLLGGNFSVLFQLYSTGSLGVVKTAAQGVAGSPYDCVLGPGLQEIMWCGNGWVTVQVIVSLAYVLLHVATCGVVACRVLMLYGGEEAFKQVEARGRSQDLEGLQNLVEGSA